MQLKLHIATLLCSILYASSVASQTPLSAIDWLEKPQSVPIVAARPTRIHPTTNDEPPIAQSAVTPKIVVTELGHQDIGAVGLLPTNVTGFPANLWRETNSDQLSSILRQLNIDAFPAMQSLLYTLLLAEVEPPKNDGKEAAFLLARIDKLMDIGAVDPAEAMLLRAGTTSSAATPELFQRWFDLTLLNGSEDTACAALKSRPELSPGYGAQIFCTARGGDWMTAALTLDTARVLGFISTFEADVLARFLDPEAFEGIPNLPAPNVMTPLIFRLFEANGAPLPTGALARQYAMADLRNTSGWKSELEAAERLARTSALSENRLLDIYTKGKPAASGGVWDRVKAVQKFDNAMKSGDVAAISLALPPAWRFMKSARLEVPFARLFGAKIMQIEFRPESRSQAFHVALLASSYEEAAATFMPMTKRDRFLKGIAAGVPISDDSPNAIGRAIADGFSTTVLPDRFANLIDNGELGLAILQAMQLFIRSSGGNLQGITDALVTFRAVGLEDVARRAALQLILLERQG